MTTTQRAREAIEQANVDNAWSPADIDRILAALEPILREGEVALQFQGADQFKKDLIWLLGQSGNSIPETAEHICKLIERHNLSCVPTPEEAKTGEHYFIDRDRFMSYIDREVNPARLKEGLAVLSERSCLESYRIIKSGVYHLATQPKEGGSK